MNLLQALELVKGPNYTTIDQSKYLLDLGLPSDSADCYWNNEYEKRIRQYAAETSSKFFERYKHVVPCWSVGQLIKIYLICNPYESDDDITFMLTSGVEVPDLCHYIITWLEHIKPNFDKVNEIIG